jgi:hypothetical protein
LLLAAAANNDEEKDDCLVALKRSLDEEDMEGEKEERGAEASYNCM